MPNHEDSIDIEVKNQRLYIMENSLNCGTEDDMNEEIARKYNLISFEFNR